jgi:hypothetical protein
VSESWADYFLSCYIGCTTRTSIARIQFRPVARKANTEPYVDTNRV